MHAIPNRIGVQPGRLSRSNPVLDRGGWTGAPATVSVTPDELM
jgi:hypothetical protein